MNCLLNILLYSILCVYSLLSHTHTHHHTITPSHTHTHTPSHHHTHTNTEDSLFFTQTVPQAVYDSTNLTEVCPVPDIPAATVSVVSDEGFSFCQVETERGTFRSRSITTLPGKFQN